MATKKKAAAKKPAAKPRTKKPAVKLNKGAALDPDPNSSQAQAWERGESVACAADESK